jgi:hypothetical protein
MNVAFDESESSSVATDSGEGTTALLNRKNRVHPKVTQETLGATPKFKTQSHTEEVKFAQTKNSKKGTKAK